MMNITDLDFQNNVGESSRISGGENASDSFSSIIKRELESLTGQLVGTFNAFSNVSANGINKANVSVNSNITSETMNKVSITYTTVTSAFASTPGS